MKSVMRIFVSKDNNMEEWKDIPGYEGLYQISNLGRLKSKKNNKEIIKKTYINRKNGYEYCFLYKNSNLKSILTHRIVAYLFLPNPNNYPCVNHKDENRQNNKVSNLEWCDYKYNLNYGNRCKKYSKKVNQYDLNNNYIKTWDSLKEAQIEFNTTHILDCCKGRRNSTKGFKWRYCDELCK